MSEEKYWIIPSVCTYRDFTKKDFDESIGDKFFTKYKNDDVLCKRQESTTSIDSGVEDKESADRYSVGSNSITYEQGSSSDLTKKHKRRSTEELLVRLNEIRKQNESINVKPKPKLQLRKSYTKSAIDASMPADIRLPVDSPSTTRRSSRIVSVPNGKVQSKCSVNVPVLSTRRSYSIEKTPVLRKPGILRSSSLRTSSTGMSQLYSSGTSSSKKSTTPVVVAKTLSSKISSFFSNRRSCGGRATSEPPKCSRKSKTTTIEPNISTVKLSRINTTSYGNNYSRDEVKLKTSKEKIVSIIEKLRR
uniref:Flocculation protein FLO11-like n=1 Tax=Strongyloides venezuelensis TaxID=75913 RepID=A0A0K0FNC7_STRVS